MTDNGSQGPVSTRDLFSGSPQEMVEMLRKKQQEFLASGAKDPRRSNPDNVGIPRKPPSQVRPMGQGGPRKNTGARDHQLSRRDRSRLPFWPDSSRGISNEMARSALFTAGARSRKQFKGQLVHSLKNVEMLYTGEELRQRDLDVMLQLLHFGRLTPLGDPIPFTAREMILQLGWTMNSRSYRELAEIIDRLKNASLLIRAVVKGHERGFSGSLVQTFDYYGKRGDHKSKRWQVTLEPRLSQLYNAVGYTQIDWDERMQLKPMAKWLHTFYSTHQTPYPMKLETIYHLCGTSNKEMWSFKKTLTGGLEELVEVGFLISWELTEAGLVTVIRSHAQKRVSQESAKKF